MTVGFLRTVRAVSEQPGSGHCQMDGTKSEHLSVETSCNRASGTGSLKWDTLHDSN